MSRPANESRATALVGALLLVACVTLAACGSQGLTASAPALPSGAASETASASPTTSSAGSSAGSSSGSPEATGSGLVEPVFTPVPDASQAPDTGTGAAAGDIPDNAVFLTYRSAAWQFRIQYVEGWQVTTRPDGVLIRDKDSSETVQVIQKPANVDEWIRTTDLAALQGQPGFALVKQNRVKVGSATLAHLVYHALSEPDPVTGKQVPSTVDRFYVPGPALAIISLATPDGVDNVDAFRQIIGSFAWQAG
jgi:hypothetical protein